MRSSTPTPARDIEPQHDTLNRPDLSRRSIKRVSYMVPDLRYTCPRDSQSEEMDVSSVKIMLPQSKSFQPIAKARRSTACPSVKSSLDEDLRQWIFASQTVYDRPWSAREVGRSPYMVRRTERVSFMNSANGFVLFLVEHRGLPIE